MRERILTFDDPGTFAAYKKAEAWCMAHGVSVGSSQRGAPTGLLIGDFVISKWRGMSLAEIQGLDGHIEGDMRNGPVHIVATSEALKQLAAAVPHD